MTNNGVDDQNLAQWTRRLTQALQILDLEVDHNLVLDVADHADRAASPMAAPVTTVLVGYAAGMAAAGGQGAPKTAVSQAADVVIAVCRQPADETPDDTGWVNTAQ